MSGSGNNTPDPPPEPDCRTLRFDAILSSVNAEVLEQLSSGDILRVELENDDGPIVVSTDSGQVAGSIATGLSQRLLACLRRRFEYSAEVLDVDGGRYEVRVSAS